MLGAEVMGMAQRARGAARVARRYGVLGAPAVAAALVALLALAGGALLLRGALSGGVEIERAVAEGEPVESGAAPGGGDASEGDERAEKNGRAEKDEAAEASSGDASPEEAEGAETVLVHVDGAVAAPGVYELPADARANDAVVAAGGLAPGADTSSINLAAPVGDGDKVHVPVEGEAAPSGSSEGGGASGGPVNINTATVEELDELPGVGEATARAIVEEREANGPFLLPEDIMRVSGIGEKKYERLAGEICV